MDHPFVRATLWRGKEQGRNQHEPLSRLRGTIFHSGIGDRSAKGGERIHPPGRRGKPRIRTRAAVARIRMMMKRCSGQGNLTYDILKASRPIVGVCWNVAMSDGFCVGLAAHYIWPGYCCFMMDETGDYACGNQHASSRRVSVWVLVNGATWTRVGVWVREEGPRFSPCVCSHRITS